MADPQHDIFRIVAPSGRPPLVQLLSKIGGRLCAERRIGWADAFAVFPVARDTGCKAARWIAVMIENGRLVGLPIFRAHRHERHRCIICGDGVLLRRRQLVGYRLHFGMLATPASIGFELRGHIAAVETGKAGCAGAVAAPIQAVACNTGIGRARIAAAQRDQFAGDGEAISGAPLDLTACCKPECCDADRRSVMDTHRAYWNRCRLQRFRI
ncbi:hypothetical protein L3X40_17530 [Rhizorhapis sp. SPR117]|uniref:hypothetical protein n=1 Tax=Rhizorhapis sp. SPR117 TaxID=2912611 RepID=UPI001F19320B|nr:hypothetical protein [Rhizorhapis sp. SPR117]